MHGGLQFLYDVEDGAVVFQVLLHNDPEELSALLSLEFCSLEV